jgi:Ca2+-binding EF-hand superfamily protein
MKTLTRQLRRIVPLTIACLALPPAALAVDEARLQNLFDLMDRDGNGEITRPEYQTGIGLVFATLDANVDFALTDDEIRLTPEAFHHIAGDDGKIEGPEFFRADIAAFEAIDADGNYVATFAELLSYVAKYVR